MSFNTFDLHPDLLRGVATLGFETPTPIQRDAIPPGLAGRDVLACAMTGSGKTAAFLLPILQRLLGRPRGTTRALILAPTRELAAQIDEHRQELGRQTRLTGAAIFGGVGYGPQEQAIRRGADILVATPGRLLDHLGQSYARLTGLEVLVLDEADRMLDMGFLPDIRRVLQHLPQRRQTLLFSATMPAPIVGLAREILRDPVTIAVERPAAPATGITHTAYPVAAELKSRLLLALLARPDTRSVLAFTRTKHRANRLAEFLGRNGVRVERIHGNRSQTQRTQALAGFKSGYYQVLVATDIAARGIDIDALSHVVNFDVPPLPEDYIHRVGRTARMEARGDALTLVSPSEEADLRTIERAIGSRLPRVTLPGFDYSQRQPERLEIPLPERLAAMRAQRAGQRRNAVGGRRHAAAVAR
ncbi:MAG TPA: DEAD/DEAH box helicase [Methylomirabilota bacterium]|jgi:ATP-dependent RNA helicase RhlE|nr:DEAD/DEAH box helicase [Methylomirabilota bacterium]